MGLIDGLLDGYGKRLDKRHKEVTDLFERLDRTSEERQKVLQDINMRAAEREHEIKKRKEELKNASSHPQTINIGSIGEVLGAGAIKTGDIGMVKGDIGSTDKPFSKCPYCGEASNLPKTPKFCPHCGWKLK